MYEDLRGKVAVITGGARGLGYQMAGALAAHGAEIALIDLLPEVTDSAARLASTRSVRTVGISADVTDQDSIGGAIAAVAGSLGTPSILVNAAGITSWGDSTDVTAQAWRKVIDVNLTGTFFSCQAFARSVFAAGGQGAIVNVSSMSAFVVNVPQHQVSYNASKAAVDQITRSLAVEWISKGIRVNAIAPGYFLSDMTKQFLDSNEELGKYWKTLIPAGRMGQPADLDGLVAFLASDVSQYIVGESIVIDGGYSIV
ncbi:SDR family NAD(P)-dependent oxidoreductase [Nakamurella sp. PAMC28650]|uniref:SDR family NAD(P)-dependent oxidoreductase n=1 Tax=Nakamurella sp. PAMC28650 TaxID=2762325 RepID=UPI001C9AC45C|nr:SDR family oxidoreductase [Nakamurella sp. PAMC28650]